MKRSVLFVAITMAITSGAQAQTLSSKQQYTIDTKNASTRYADDKKLCAEEATSAARMQCLRDAKTEYNNALAAAKATSSKAVTVSTKQLDSCVGCGKVIAVNVNDKEGEGSALGVIAGGVAGAILGNQVGNGSGRDLATIAGAAGGAYAGRKIEQKAKSSKVWEVTVQYDNGEKNTFSFDHDPGLNNGDRVKNSGSSIIRH
ncbi:glycine zipper 2TM domain-containing protein [Undibacterium sp. Jales W-56]|uniref:glycine zipper 2TM domain-containing protein n=1 Tax=Undibacterium sp. Jales W-56 TaxID=2897325 RepID=UPI0021D1F71C|nr:glycine zipper 2TM domain-containing protein [Undibacterium sp. Jales W-56]MCU6432838.1 glycine zipper 2TM domain-containing protein [Undibacterium sp. Jales W-56]